MRSIVLVTLALLAGCAGKKTPKATLVIPVPCVQKIIGTCVNLNDRQASCKVVVDYTCVKVQNESAK
jgi:hypothetical protein